MKKKTVIRSGLGLLLILLSVFGWLGYQMKPLLVGTDFSLDKNLHIFIGGGGNSIVLISEDKQQALLVDTKMGRNAKQLKAYIDDVAPVAQLFIVNTHYHSDHTKGNDLFPKATLITGNYSNDFWKSQVGERLPDERIKNGQEIILLIGDEQVHIRNMGQAHTWNDMVVYLEHRQLLMTGDLVFNGWHPVLIETAGTNIQKWIRVLEDLMQRYDVKTLVPGHGPVTDQNGLSKKREYFVSIQAAADDPVKLDLLREKYKDFLALPGMSGFDKTRQFIQSEK